MGQPCTYCQKFCVQQFFNTATHQWEWSHESCRPFKPMRERRYTRENAPMGYVPRAYAHVQREKGPSEEFGYRIRKHQKEQGIV